MGFLNHVEQVLECYTSFAVGQIVVNYICAVA